MNPFLHSIFEGYSGSELRIEIRCLAPKWRGGDNYPTSHYFPLTANAIKGAAAFAKSKSADFDVYVGVLPRVGNTRSNSGVFGAACLYADVDGGEEGYHGSIDLLKRTGLPKPNIAVISGGGIHAYWLLDAPFIFETQEHREKFSTTLRRLQKAIGGASPNAHADEACKDAARILRVPDTLNWKRQEEPREVKMVRNDATTRLSYTEWLNLLPLVPTVTYNTHKSDYKPTNELPQWVVDWIITPLGEGSRNRELTRVACYLGRDYSLPLPTVIHILSCKQCTPPVPPREIEAIAKWAMKG